MMRIVEEGCAFKRHQKKRSATTRWIVVRKNRLHWKEKRGDRNQGGRCFYFRNFKFVTPGKATKALKEATDLDESNCFTIAATVDNSTKTLDLSTDASADCHAWVIYLQSLMTHYQNSYQALQEARKM